MVFVLATIGVLVKLETVLFEQVVAAPKFSDTPVILLFPVVTLLNVLPVNVFVGPFAFETPSVLLHPMTPVAPVRFALEKTFPVWVMLDPFTDDAFAPYMATVPPATVLANPVTTWLLLQLSDPVAVMLPARAINVTEPLVFRLRFVNVFRLILSATDEACDQLIGKTPPVPATV